MKTPIIKEIAKERGWKVEEVPLSPMPETKKEHREVEGIVHCLEQK